MNSGPFLVVGSLIFVVGVMQIAAYNHEVVHQNIYKNAGINSTIKMGFMTGSVQPAGRPEAAEDRRAMELAHAMNDAVWYNTNPFLFAICILLAIKAGCER